MGHPREIDEKTDEQVQPYIEELKDSRIITIIRTSISTIIHAKPKMSS